MPIAHDTGKRSGPEGLAEVGVGRGEGTHDLKCYRVHVQVFRAMFRAGASGNPRATRLSGRFDEVITSLSSWLLSWLTWLPGLGSLAGVAPRIEERDQSDR